MNYSNSKEQIKGFIPNPTVEERTSDGTRTYDIYSRLLKDRIVMLKDEVCEDSINPVIAQLLFLNNEDPEKPIYLYIDSPGGSCTAGLALIDIMNFITAPVYTVCLGMAASMGAAILSCGTKRFALPNSTVMCHQVSGGFKGTIMDHEVNFEYEKKLNERLMKIIAANCKMDYKKFIKAVDRDKYMFAEDALKFGIVDEILTNEIREDE